MANLNSMPKYQAKLPRTGHDIGRDIYFTSSVGQILPIYRTRLQPGEVVDFSVAMKTILRPLRRPTQCKIRQKVDVFFVPEQMLYTGFGQHFYQTNDFVTSAIDSSVNGAILPLMNLGKGLDAGSLKSSTRSLIDVSQVDVSLTEDNNFNGFDALGKSAFRLLMHLGYNPSCIYKRVTELGMYSTGEFSCFQPNVYPDFLLAYNAIYENYYRNDDREKRNLKSYQYDWAYDVFNSDGADTVFTSYPTIGITTRCHQRIKDYFTSMKVSPIMSVLNMPSVAGPDLLKRVNNFLFVSDPDFDSNINFIQGTSLLSDISFNSYDSGVAPYLDDSTSSNATLTSFASDANSISPANIRGVFAVEKLMRITGRARKNYDSQVLAHLGVKVPRDIKHEISFIGSIDGGIGVQTHLSLAGTEQVELGEQFGNGGGNLSGKVRRFTAPCHGVFMAVTYAIPETSYPMGHYLDKLNNVTSRLDLPIPEFDKLGMQPVYLFEHFMDGVYTTTQLSLNTGWQYRYEQYKRQYDVHSLAFYNPHGSDLTNSWSPWVLGNVPFNNYNSDREWIDDDDHSQGYTVNFQFPQPSSFMVAPTFLNGIFVQDYDTNLYLSNKEGERNDAAAPWLMFQTDPFMHAARINCKLISNMSTFGEPELD